MKRRNGFGTLKFIGVDSSLVDELSLPTATFSKFSGNLVVLPGFCDVHVHFREPGFSYKETILSGSKAAARGGYTTVCTMPNLNPVPDSLAHLQLQREIIETDSVIRTVPYGSITVGQKGEEMADLEAMAPFVPGFSDDGHGVQNEEMMRNAMICAKKLGKVIVAHCEVNSLLNGGYIHQGAYAEEHGHRGISSASEYEQIARDLKLVSEIGCDYHVCHISTKESVELIRDAKMAGVNVTCETAPHYLVLDENALREDGRFKMNPPLRSSKDREALVEGLADGTIDMIATDHAPHTREEKSRGLEKSAFGVVGLETAFPVLYTHLVKKGVISLEHLVNALTANPRNRFSLPLEKGFSVWDLDREFTVNPEEFCSMGRSTPFEGEKLFASCLLTSLDGKVIYRNC